MAEACTTLAIADHDQRCETEALAALHRLRNAVDVNQLLDQLFAAVIVTRTAIVATTTIATTLAIVTATTAAAAIAASATLTLWRSRCCIRSGRLWRTSFDLGFVSHLELQSGFARRVGQSLYATMKEKTAAIEHDLRDARLGGALRNALADFGSRVLGRAGLDLAVLVQRRRGCDRAARLVVDDLGVDMPARAMDRKPGAQTALGTQGNANALTPLFEK
jgi:hypothetical protein